MEIKIGMQSVARELVLDVEGTVDSLTQDVEQAMKDGAPLRLTDTKGRRVVLNGKTISYLEFSQDEPRRVGFGIVS